jgi:hypothetical protein
MIPPALRYVVSFRFVSGPKAVPVSCILIRGDEWIVPDGLGYQ